MAFRPSICPECGREFYPAPQHTYVVDGKKVCRYNCYNAALKRKEEKSKAYKQMQKILKKS